MEQRRGLLRRRTGLHCLAHEVACTIELTRGVCGVGGRADNILAGLVATAKNPKDFKIVGETLSVEPIAIMIRKDDPGMKRIVDITIRGLMDSGELDKLYKKWFLSPIPPKNTTVNLVMGTTLKGLFKDPNDNPMESYAAK